MKKLYFNRFISLFLCLFLSLSVAFVPVQPVRAAAPALPALVGYILTAIGAVSAGNNVIEGLTGTDLLNELSTVVQTCLGDGSIYIDSNGDYVFNSDSTKAIYEALTSDASKTAKVISSFPDYRTFSGENFDNTFVNSDFWSALQSNLFGLSLVSIIQQNSGVYHTTFCKIFDISDVSYFYIDGSGSNGFLNFRRSNGSSATVDKKQFDCSFNSSSGVYSNSSVSTGTDSAVVYSGFGGDANNKLLYDNFPFFSYTSGQNCYGCLVYCNRSVVLCLNSSAGMALVNKDSGVIYNNYYDVIPSVSSTVIEENNWENIYNSYVTTVNNQYQQIYDSNGSVTADEIRAILKDVGDRIDEIISDAGGEIVENLDDILTWLSRIYERLGLIEDGLSQVSDNQIEVESVISDMKDIVDSYSSDLARLQQIYVVLGQILNAIPSVGGGGGGINIDIVTDVPDLLDDDVLDLIDKGDVLESALESVVPFCFIPFFGVLINAFAVTPTDAPSFVMPLKLSNTLVDIDLEEEISLEWFDSVHDAYVAGWCLLLIVALMYLTFKLFYFINSMI